MRPETFAFAVLTSLLLIVPAASLADPLAPCSDPRVVPGQGLSCPADDGGWDVVLEDGSTVPTHGGDPLVDPAACLGLGGGDGVPAPRTCEVVPPDCAPSIDDHHIVLIYAHAHDRENRHAELVDGLREMAATVNGIVHHEAATEEVEADLELRCDGAGDVAVLNVTLPTDDDDLSFGAVVSDLQAMGLDRSHVNHWVWLDGSIGRSRATLYRDDRLASDNRNLVEPGYAVTNGYVLADGSVGPVHTMLHELGHTMGAVHPSAPWSTGAGHCRDGQDIMCYEDREPGAWTFNQWVDFATTPSVPARCPEREWFDCRHDTYFDPDPEPGTWLADHWNLGHPLNGFIAFG